MTILPLTYLGSTDWFARLMREECVIDIGENWVKQTARNRAEILAANGVATLTVPVHGGQGSCDAKIATRDIKIDNSKRWQHQHWVSIVSAYKNSPYFDHYEGYFAPIFTERKFGRLVDLNLELLNIVARILGIEDRIKISENYLVVSPGDVDLRGKKALRRDRDETRIKDSTFRPSAKTDSEDTLGSAYIQVFSDRMEFVPGLSVIDLVMCEGTAAMSLLRGR